MTRASLFLVFAFWGVLANFCAAATTTRTVHVFVALADNDHQGIVPVPAKIGNGDDAAANLYWGCDEGLKSLFKRAKEWRLVGVPQAAHESILERLIFKHRATNTWLVADAWRGREIKQATASFLAASAGEQAEEIEIFDSGKSHHLAIGGRASLVAYIGHDGLMDFELPSATAQSGKPAIVLCCVSKTHFGPHLQSRGARPLLLTTQLMYPGSFILKSALEGWVRGESTEQLRQRTARAYATNQGISLKAALGVFCTGDLLQ